jgi:hypothetical protein
MLRVMALLDPPQLQLAHADFAVTTWRNAFIQIWRTNPIEQHTRAMREAGKRFLMAHKGSVVALIVVEKTCPIPGSEARVHSVAFLKDLHGRAEGIVLVFEGEGFRAAASRATMVTLMTAARVPFPYHVTATTAEAEQHLLRKVISPGLASSRGQLVDAVEWSRAKIEVETRTATH